MIDLKALTLYKEKISSYIDENVLTFPTQSKINSLFNEVHKYKIVIFNKPTGGGNYNTSAVSKLKLFKNNQGLTVKSVKAINGSNATGILTDGERDYTLTLAADSYYDDGYNSYPIRNAFGPSGWLSANGIPANMTLEFEMDNLTEISYRPCEEQTYSDGYGNENTIIVFCDDTQIYSGNANISVDRRHSGYIHINFNDYDDVNVNIIYTA